MTNNKLNIGLFTCHLDNDYALSMCTGAEYAAKELDVNLLIFPGMFLNASFNDPENELYDYQYNAGFYYANKENLDVLIIALGAIGPFLSEKNIHDFLAHFEDIPIITLETKIEGYPCIQTDNSSGLKEAIEHLIQVHNRKHIGFVSGRQGNADAIERLNIYKSTLKAHNMSVSEDMIVYGDFSEFSQPIVSELLDKNPDIDAIVFGNDQMAIGGYAELKKRGIKIGTDISVIGFDDSPVAATMDPPLTTVNSNTTELGYRAVCEAVKLYTTGIVSSCIVDSHFIKRVSCSCDLSDFSLEAFNPKTKDINQQLKILDDILLYEIKDTFYAEYVCEKFNDIWRDILEYINDPEILIYPKESIKNKLYDMLRSDITQVFPANKIAYVFRRFTSLCGIRITDSVKQSGFNQITVNINGFLSQFQASALYNEMRDTKTSTWSSVYIIRDTLTYGSNLNRTYSQILSKLKDVGFEAAYLYTYDDNIRIDDNGSWQIPKSLFLQAYYNSINTNVLFGETRITPSEEIFDNEHTYYEKRFTAVVVPIFTNEQHHGLFVCNTDIEHFKHIYTTCLHLGASFKYLTLLDEQNQTKEQLMMSLKEIHEKNELLNHLSTSDELTGVNNRRGFMDKVEFLINMPSNYGRPAMLLFADMDSLKVVNDKFGHKDGDFALKNIAHILSSSFRPEDIIGRIGGDEFVSFAFVDKPDFAETVQNRINELSDELNETSGKPYFIEMSVGISEFICNENVKIEDLLSQADNSLYTNKRYKRISVIK
jgi:diguanylate cyclase (GGDEF)-like protein